MINCKKNIRKAIAAVSAVVIAGGAAAVSCMTSAPRAEAAQTVTAGSYTGKKPKYIFMFIGDGMSYPQVQLSADYYSALAATNNNSILEANKKLSFMTFPVCGSAVTYDSTSFCPDSASTATSLATGYKTYSGTINMDETFTVEYETIAEKLKEQLGYKVGIVSTVNLNHATPAAYYAHQASRNDYYEISCELIESGFDYFAGGALKDTTKGGTATDSYTLAEQAGYKVIKTQDEAEKLTAADGKAIVISETIADSGSMSYNNDRKADEWALADYVEKGIEVLDNDNGFFMMVEGGKIDWACHANDAGSTISDTVALSSAVSKAVDFYNKHPDETLIIVTGDHETGGLTIGYAGTNYDTFLTNLKNQKISYAKFDSDYVSKYKENNTSFSAVMKDITKLFGLTAPAGTPEAEVQLDSADKHPESDNSGTLEMTEYEYEKLKAAYEETMTRTADDEITQEEYLLYGSYEPLTVTITHILNNKSGVNFASYAHTGLPVAVFAQGAGSELFEGYYDNTDIYDNLAALTQVK
ncbi:MAG: alkaline phosphatase [Oscillospiraceae bacterium]|nr:alkaline phosphatase [Oscillospiraceae bacterium]